MTTPCDHGELEIPVADGTLMYGYLAQPAVRSATAVIVVHELFGVNPDLHGVVDDLCHAGFVTVAPELYHRGAPRGHWLVRDDIGRAEGFALLHQLTRDGVLLDIAATMRVLESSYGAERIAIVGFSAGGHVAYLAACELPVTSTVVLYGGWLTGTEIVLSRPSPTLDLTPGITGRLTYLVGEDDAIIGAAEQSSIAAALQSAGVEHEMVTYPGVGHAFFWPDTPGYDEPARTDAWRRILAAL
jgi:carboxymethylenebutenolidase